ncbi:galactose-binding domain-containing protein, partial [Streptomyces tubercidicus]
MSGDINVILAGGTYKLTTPLSLSPQDSGANGYKVNWQAAPGAHPVISGGTTITGWAETATAGVWKATVPADFETRQLYASGVRIPRTSGKLGTGPLAGVSLTQTSTGFTASNTTLGTWKNPSNIEFALTHNNANGTPDGWYELRCDAASISGTSITMRQPCWDNGHMADQPTTPNGFDTAGWNPSGGFWGLSGAVVSSIENAYELLTPGHWYLDESANVIYYNAQSGDDVPKMNFVAPTLEQLMISTGTPGNPVHDITFQGLEFAYSTWLRPSSNEGFAEMQANMTVTGAGGSKSQGLCGYSSPAGSCPFGAWARQPAAVDLTGTRNVSFLDNKFAHIGSAGLGLSHGADTDVVKGNEFNDISGNGIVLGAIDDQQPSENLALSKTATQSSTLSGSSASASLAVDGNTDGKYNDGSVSHTDSNANAWWKVDLGSSQRLTSINVFNRTDSCCSS